LLHGEINNFEFAKRLEQYSINIVFAISYYDTIRMSLIFGPHPVVEPRKNNPNAVVIQHVRAFVFGNDNQEMTLGGGADCHKQEKGHWIVDSDIANPMSVYKQYRASRTSWGIDAMGSVVVEVELSNGMKGVGISIGGDAACYIVEKHLSRFAEGQDPSNVELIWDQCWRSTMNYGRKGIAVQAISALDLAIWDALGHLRNLPVYALLGGKTKENACVCHHGTARSCQEQNTVA
jgi:hypothetical protein